MVARSRYPNMKSASLFFLACAAALTPLRAAEPPKPNILLLFADDQRADTIHALGNPIIKTPNLDRLVRRGLSFDRAYMQGGMQGATCVPSRAMLLSGQNLFHIDENLMRDATWSEAFGKAGYTTFVSGKWHNGDASLVRGFQTARGIFTGGMTNPMQAKLRDVTGGRVGEAKLAPQHACAVFADEAIRFLQQHRGGPFFAYVPFDAPHDPHVVPDDFPVVYDPQTIPLPPSFLPQHPWNNGEMEVRDEKLLPWPRPPDQVRELIAEYYRYVSYLDMQIGRVLDALYASPFAEETIVVFTADSGVARGSHGLVGKQSVYEYDSVRVPLIIAGPRIASNERTEAMVYLFDVLPTLGKLCGIAPPNRGDNLDFATTLRDPVTPARDRMMFAYRDVQRGYTDGRWKLIRYPRVDRTELFDLDNDPHEAVNLAEKPEHAVRIAELTTALANEMKASGDTAQLKIANPEPAAWTPPAERQQERKVESKKRRGPARPTT
jgi:arylsulfatase A-like enzyme